MHCVISVTDSNLLYYSKILRRIREEKAVTHPGHTSKHKHLAFQHLNCHSSMYQINSYISDEDERASACLRLSWFWMKIVPSFAVLGMSIQPVTHQLNPKKVCLANLGWGQIGISSLKTSIVHVGWAWWHQRDPGDLFAVISCSWNVSQSRRDLL